MNLTDAMLWRMIWKEYRVQRGFWLVIAAFAIVLMLLFLWLLDAADSGRIAAAWIIAVSLPAVYALGCAGVMFAGEREDQTTDMLRIMAARTSRVFLGKLGFCVASTAAMCGVLLAAALLLTWGHDIRRLDRDVFDHQVWIIATVAVQFIAWGIVFSALCRRALTAVCLTAVTPFIVALCAANTGLFDQRPEPYVWYFGLVLVVPLVGISYFLTQRTMTGKPHRSYGTYTTYGARWASAIPRTLALSLAALNRKVRASVNPLDRLAAVKETAPAWRRTLQRLFWLEWRHVFSIGHVLWIAAVYVLAFVPFRNVRGSGMWGMIGIAILPLFMGIWTFQAEQGRRIRFLADHGLSPQVVWLAKQLVWGTLTAALTLPFILSVDAGNAEMIQSSQITGTSAFHQDVPGASAAVFTAIVACLGYATGQFASMLIARGVTAGFIGGVLYWLTAWFTWCMVELRVPIAFSVLPLLTVLIVTTYVWSRNWLLEQATARSWLKLTCVLALSLMAVYGSIGTFRVYEVPRPDFVERLAPLRQAHGIAPSPDAIETATLYRAMLSRLKWDWGPEATAARPVVGERLLNQGWDHASELERTLLADNQKTLQLGLAATERPNCAFIDPSQPISESQSESTEFISFNRCQAFATLILLSAREREAQGKLDEALDRYVAVLRLARHFASYGTTFDWSLGAYLESMVGRWIGPWAAHPDQTAERLEAAAARIGQETARFPSLYDAVLTQQFMLRHTVEHDWSDLLPKFQNPNDAAQSRTILKVLDRLCPWEHERCLRVVDLLGASEFHCLDVLDQGLAKPGLDMQYLARLADAVPTATDPTYLAINGQLQPFPGNDMGLGDFFNPQPNGATRQDRIPWKWLATTYPLNAGLNRMVNMAEYGTHHEQLWHMRLGRELFLRSTCLRLKLIAYKKAHGEYPDQLTGHNFASASPARVAGAAPRRTADIDMNAIDPYSGEEFEYRREGYPFRIHVSSSATLPPDVVPAGRAIFWSAGPAHICRFAPAPTEVNSMREEPDGTFVRSTEIVPVAHTSARVFPLP